MKNILKTTFVVTFLCLFSCRLQAQVLFNLSSTLPVGSDPNSIAVADINGDGKADLICANYLGNTLSVLTNNSSGGYVLSGTYGNVGSLPIVVTAADVNGDGKVDLICVGSTLTVLTNNGTGGFVPSGQYATVGNGPAWVTAADVNGDGRPDLITANWGSGSGNTLTVLTNNGSGGFVIASAPVTGNGTICVAAVDVNGDGKVDLISANMTDSTLSVLTNTGSGGFILAASCPVGNGSRFVTAADVNGDGRPDLISANWGDNTLTVLTNNGSGGFGFQSTITVGNGALFVAAADINGDGAVDLICANNTDYTLTVVTNSGGGGFILATNLSVGGNPNCVVALDVNGDGRLDLISASYQNNALIVWMNATPFLPFAPPGITAQPISITNLAGTTATFSVEASGGALAYQWQFNGTNLAVATNNLLILPNLAPSQAGSYSVLVSNALGSTNSLAATLTVLAYPPTITAQPTNQAVLVGGTAPFSVSASGTGPLSYQWAFNGSNIDGATSATLTLGNVQLTNAGNYSVVVTNTSGSILSSNALLTVNPAPANVPVITAFSPQSGADGTMVNITGFNFDPTPGNNTVHFGAVRAVVSAASATNLVVGVPVGATFAPIAETVNGLTAYAGAPFLPTFPSSGTLTNSSLGSQITLPTGNGPGKALIADFDGDGKSDLAVNCGNYHTVYVYRNISTNGTLTAGSFAPPVVLQLGTGGEEEMAAADLTGDGKLDLVFLDYNFNAVGVLQNLCTPGSITTNSFGPRVNFAVGSGPVGVALQDLDGDGKPEIVTANLGGGTISVLRNLGTASMITTNSFAPAVNFAGPTSVRAVAIADMDGDGKPDVVALNWVSGSYNSAVSVFRNVSTLGNIAFASRVDFPGLIYCYKLAIGDMDGDGKLDAVFVSFAKGQSVSVYRNTSAPGNFTTNSFAPRVDFGLGGWGNGVTLGDLDGDGKPDVAAVTQSSSQLSLFRNISAPGSFSSSSLAARLNFASGTNPYGVAIGDLDGDGRPEVVLVNNSSASMSIYQNVVPFGGPPVVTTQPQCQTNVVGSTVSFGVVASGTVPLGYQWMFGGANIIGATNATLTLNNVQLTNVGNYMVTITNIAGSTNSVTATLTVNLPVCAPAPSGLVGWWRAEGDAHDVIGGNHGTLGSGANFTDGEVGQAFSFNGTSSSYVSIPDSPLLDSFTNSITIELWLKANQTNANSNWQTIVSKGNAAWEIQATVYARTVSFFMGGPNPSNVTGSRNVQDGQWHHVAAVYDGTNINLYVDGTLDASTPSTGGIVQNSYPMGIGYSAQGLGGSPGYFYNGKVDEVSLYHRALSAGEIAAIYNAGSAGKCYTPVAPAITAQPTNLTVLVGRTATYSVAATGTSPLSFQWAFNGTNIDGATDATLTLGNVQLTQAGSYSVLVSNLVGSTNSVTATLSVVLPPVITQQPQGQSAASYNSASFTVAATGSGPLSYQWRKGGTNLVDGSNVSGSTTTNLTLASVSMNDGGNYDVVVSNPYATTNSAVAVLTVPPTGMMLVLSCIDKRNNICQYGACPEQHGRSLAVRKTAKG